MRISSQRSENFKNASINLMRLLSAPAEAEERLQESIEHAEEVYEKLNEAENEYQEAEDDYHNTEANFDEHCG